MFGSFGYGIWAIIAISDGHGGIEIPINVAIPVMTAIILLTITSVAMRVGDRAAEQVIESIVDQHFELLISAVDSKLKANNKHLHGMVKAEVAAALEEVSTRTYRAALVNQAAAAAADVSDATITRIPTGRR